MNVISFHCGPFANESERTAFEHVRSRIESSLGPGDDHWILLTNLTWSVTHRFQADEIDMIAVGPPGVRVIEVKHWSRRWVDEHLDLVNQEADRVTNKARNSRTVTVRLTAQVDGLERLEEPSAGSRPGEKHPSERGHTDRLDRLGRKIEDAVALRLTEADAKALVRNVATARQERTLIDKIKQMARFKALYFCEGRPRPSPVSLRSLD